MTDPVITPEMVEAALRAEFSSYYSDPWNYLRGSAPSEMAVDSIVVGVLNRLLSAGNSQPINDPTGLLGSLERAERWARTGVYEP